MTDNTAISFCYIHNLRNILLQLGIKDGDEIIVSYYIKTDSTTFTDSIIGNMECLINKVDLENPAISNNWQRVSYKGTFSTTTTYQAMYIVPNKTYSTLASNEHIYITSIKIEKGNKVTDWTPAPEDVDSSIGDVQTVALGAQSAVEAVNEVANQASVDVESIKGYIQNLVVDKNGQSMMTQTGKGWQFNMGTVNSNLDSLSKAVDDMSNDNEDTKAILNNVKSLAESIADKTAYINVDYTIDASGNPIPRMILGAETSAFKIRITNESIDFMESDTVMAYATSNTFYNLTTVVQKELEIGSGPSFVWTVRSNGNLGLTYKS